MGRLLRKAKTVASLVRGRGAGYVERLDAERAAGWLLPEGAAPAMVSLYVDGYHELNFLADRPRADVVAVHHSSRNCGFDFPMPAILRDGRAHLVELRAGPDGAVLRHGRQRIAADASLQDAPGTDANGGHGEGVVFFDEANASLAGWARGCGAVSLYLDKEPRREIPLDRAVAGFDPAGLAGFAIPLLPEQMDGQWHEATLRLGRDGRELDGSPVRFRVEPDREQVEIVRYQGRQLDFLLRDRAGRRVPMPVSVRVLADGEVVQPVQGTGCLKVVLPPDARHLVVERWPMQEAEPTGAGEGAGQVLARFVIDAAGLQPWPAAVSDAVDRELMERAAREFSAFCGAPDARFDAAWYASSYDDCLSPETALEHYREKGARAGHSPGPLFDEKAARHLHPALAAAVARGELPCLFALELVLGEGGLCTLTGLETGLEMGLETGLNAVPAPAGPHSAPAPVSPRLPVPVMQQDPAHGIYAAWLARLDITPDIRAAVAEDEARAFRDIQGKELRHAPLVSIIMPSWNRAFTIGEAIQSVLDQSYENWELLICDDASEDRTAEVVHSFDDPRIRYMKFSKSGGAGARNKGLRFARGEYIAYLDSDNLWHPVFLDLMVRSLLAHPGRALAYCAYLDTEIVGARVRLARIARTAFNPVRLAKRNFIDMNTILHHRRLYDWLGGFDESLPRLQDWDLLLCYCAIYRPVFVDRIGVFYRRNVAWGQLTHLHANSDARDTVLTKLERRRETGPQRLAIDWPARGRVTILSGAGASPAEHALAERLAQLSAEVADVDLVHLGGPQPGTWPQTPAITRHYPDPALAADPLRLGLLLGGRLSAQPVLSVSVEESCLHALAGLDPARCLRLSTEKAGLALRSLAANGACYHLGSVPLDIPGSRPYPDPGRSLVLVFPAPDQDEEALTQAAARLGFDLLLPPGPAGGWRLQRGTTGPQVLPVAAGAIFPDEVGQVTFAVSMCMSDRLDPWALSLLDRLRAQGVVLAVNDDDAGLGGQWIAVQAAYAIKCNTPDWIFEKIAKLKADRPASDRLRAQGRRAHALEAHPALIEDRLADLLFQELFGMAWGEENGQH